MALCQWKIAIFIDQIIFGVLPMIGKTDLISLIVILFLNIYGLIFTIFNKERFGEISKNKKVLLLLFYLLSIIFLDIWIFIPVTSFINLLILDKLYKESRLDDVTLQTKYGCLFKVSNLRKNIELFFIFSFCSCLCSVVLIGMFSTVEKNNFRPEVLNVVKLSYLELGQFIPQYKSILMDTSVDDFIKARNNDRIYNSINCGLLSNKECQELRSKYL